MKFTIDWLKEHLDTTASMDTIIEALEKFGLPCENIFRAHPAWAQVEFVKIINKEKHPNADKLALYDIELTNGQMKKIVCGDASLEIDMLVPYARDGLVVPSNGITLKIAKIRGIDSPGMLCSAADLCLPITKTGVIHFSDKSIFGKTISQVFESTGIIEIEVTPNRGDVLSIRGIARILSYYHIGTLKPLIAPSQSYKETSDLAKIDSPDCMALAVASIEHKAFATNYSIIARLLLTDHFVTNIDIIDLTNYVTHELGQPMHAFDATKLAGPINITNLTQASEYETLTGQKIVLDKGTLIIQDDEKIVSWPGVIGGNNSKTEVTTSKILLETGVFKIDSILRRKHKIQSTAAKKFEYGVNIDNLENAINRYCYLLGSDATKAENHKCLQKKTIAFNLNYITKILGINITLDMLKTRLEPRGFRFNIQTQTNLECQKEIQNSNEKSSANKNVDNIFITVPSYKFFDIHTPNCIVEEYATGYYDEIESINLPPRMPITTKSQNSLANLLQQSAIACGFYETYHITLTNSHNLEFSDKISEDIAIINSTNSNYSTLRASIIPQLLKTYQWHVANNYPQRNFFEIGHVYGKYSNYQTNVFTALAPDPAQLLQIFYHFLEMNELKAPNTESIITQKWQNSGITFFHKDAIIAACGQINATLVKAEIDNKDAFYALEIYLDEVEFDKKHYAKPSIQAPIFKDISFVLPEHTHVNAITNLLEKHGYQYEIFDIHPKNEVNIQRNLGMRFQFTLDEIVTKIELNDKIEAIKTLVLKELNIISN